jgi:hypothetical protein
VATARANRILSGTGGTVLFNSGTSNAITDTGTGIFISGAVGNVTVQADTELTGTEGIDINGGSGTFTFTDTDINLTGAGVALDVNGGTSNVMFQAASSITHSVNSGAAVNVSGGHNTGTVDIDGTIDTSGFNLGLQFNNAQRPVGDRHFQRLRRHFHLHQHVDHKHRRGCLQGDRRRRQHQLDRWQPC